MADAIYQAFTMGQEERQSRMREAPGRDQKNDIVNWVNSFLRAGISGDLDDFPQMEFFVPKQ